MEACYVVPTANPEMARKTLPAWRGLGFRVLVLQDKARFDLPPGIEVVTQGAYLGYPAAVNTLCAMCPGDALVCTGGDDIWPDPGVTARRAVEVYRSRFPDGDGVVQPVGDSLDGTDRICGSPWMGPEFRKRVNGGRGPFWPGYFHFYCDEEMFNVTKSRGLLFQDRGVCQRHDHWSRLGVPQPGHIAPAQSRWDVDKALFLERKASGFPGAWPG